MNIWYCEICKAFKTLVSVQEPTKGGILLHGIMECKRCGNNLGLPMNSAEIKANELNLLLKVNTNLNDLFVAITTPKRF